jgi:hypothetical protein
MMLGGGGYASPMRFKLGFAAGLAAGWWLGSTPAHERRAKLDRMWTGVRDSPRVQRLTDTVTTDARRLGDAVEQRVVDTTDTAVKAVAGTVEPGDASDTSPTGGGRKSA